MSRRHYLLLEVMIALGIVALCALPLLRPIFAATRHEAKLTKSLERQFEADQAFAAIRQLLYENKIPWEAIGSGKGKDRPYVGRLSSPNCTYEVSEIDSHSEYTEAGYLACTTSLMQIVINLDGERFAFEQMAERLPKTH